MQDSVSSQIVSNTLIIRNNVSNNIVYNQTQTTFRYEHILPSNTLINGTYYNASLRVTNNQGETSVLSVPIQFWCYSTPQIGFTNFPDNGVISNASYTFQFSYVQNEKEPISSYNVLLYDVYKNLVSSSGVEYVQNGTPPYIGEYTFNGFDNNSAYFVQLKIITQEGTEVSTELQEFTVKYAHPDIFTLFELNNNCEEGYITLNSNLVVIDGESYPHPPVYINDKEVDLRPYNYWVQWSKGYSISNDFLMRAWLRSPTPNKEIIKLNNKAGQTISILYRNGYENVSALDMQAYFECVVSSVNGEQYYIYSNYVGIQSSSNYYMVWLNRVDNIYELKVSTL